MTHDTAPLKAPCCAVLVNYFGAAEIAAAVRCVLSDAPWAEVLVVDNSADVAEHAKLQALLPTAVRIIDAGANIGFGRACNLAWAACDAPFVFFVNPDVRLVGPGCVAALLQALQSNEQLAAVAPRQFIDDACQWQLPPAWLPTAVRAWVHEKAQRDARAAQRLARASRAENLRLWTAHAPVRQRALSGGALMLRRAALAPAEAPFDARFFMYYEDSDLCLRLRRTGWRMAVVPAARAIHAWRNEPHKHAMMQQSQTVYFDKHCPPGSTARRWLDQAAALDRSPARPALPGPSEKAQGPCLLPASAHPPSLDVPPQWHGGWLLELGFSPLLQPAIGRMGQGARAAVSAPVWQCFLGAPMYARLSAHSRPP